MEINTILSDFPILRREVNGHRLVYLDNAATSLTPEPVVAAIADAYRNHKSNVHRGIHTLSQETTTLMERSRECVARFIGAASSSSIVFTRGTTEAINLVAATISRNWDTDAEVIVTAMEHHSNIVPWQLAGAKLRVIPLMPDGSLDMAAVEGLFSTRTRLMAVAHVSNVLGTVNPVARLVAIAHRHGVPILVDGAQAVAHMPVDVQAIDCDYYAFSAHKMYGPTGVGVLYGKPEALAQLPPYQGGGEMVDKVTFEHTTFEDAPLRFEAGTPNFVDILAMPAAIGYIEHLGWDAIYSVEHELLERAVRGLSAIEGVRLIGTAPGKDAVLSFVVEGGSSYDVGLLLDRLGIAVRTGHHCAQPLMEALGITGTVRASFAPYNTMEDVDAFVAAVSKVVRMLS